MFFMTPTETSRVADQDVPDIKTSRVGIPQSDWAKHQAIIRVLYLEQDHNLEDTRRIMEDEHAFTATPNMYKQKFQEWGWVKNVPQHWIPKLAQIVEERKPRDTVFQLGPKEWTSGEIMRKSKRMNISDPEATSPVLPSELVVKTPQTSPLLPFSLLNLTHQTPFPAALPDTHIPGPSMLSGPWYQRPSPLLSTIRDPSFILTPGFLDEVLLGLETDIAQLMTEAKSHVSEDVARQIDEAMGKFHEESKILIEKAQPNERKKPNPNQN
ncbi:Clr5 domain-containing protein [Hypoxylon sp. NC1633]|nr:Clr5 domain-containing protein [Hypoxylon sp. NC1633]